MSHGRDTTPKPYGIVAEFSSGDDLLTAAQAARDKGYKKMEGYSPIPVHGLTDVLGFEDNRLGWAVFGAGIAGALGGLFLQAYTSMGIRFGDGFVQWTGLNGYAHNTGGKPLFSLPAFVPVMFECTILLAGLTAAGAMFAFNGLPKPHHPVMNAEAMQRVTADRFCLCIEADDPLYNQEEVVTFLQNLEPLSIEVVKTSEGY